MIKVPEHFNLFKDYEFSSLKDWVDSLEKIMDRAVQKRAIGQPSLDAFKDFMMLQQSVLTDGVHVVSPDLTILHNFARLSDIKECWFHNGKFKHYDLPKKRRHKLLAGAIKVSSRDIVWALKNL
jgi:hypothetical protein